MEELSEIDVLVLQAVRSKRHCHEIDVLEAVRMEAHVPREEDVFQSLDRLSIEGLLDHHKVYDDKKRRHYKLTEDGTKALEAFEKKSGRQAHLRREDE